MTNLIATLIVTAVTNWGIADIDYDQGTFLQHGEVIERTVAVLSWRGRQVETPLGDERVAVVSRKGIL